MATGVPASSQGKLASTTFFSTDQLGDTPYTQYFVSSTYSLDPGVVAAPVAPPATGAKTPCEIINAHAPTMVRTIVWEAVRQGMYPVIPSSDPVSTNEVLIYKDVSPVSSGLGADGQTRMWQCRGTYIYAVVQPYSDSDGYVVGRRPDDANTTRYGVTQDNFSKSLL